MAYDRADSCDAEQPADDPVRMKRSLPTLRGPGPARAAGLRQL